MNIHFISEKNMSITQMNFGSSIKGLFLGLKRPRYITIDKKEFESFIGTEKQMILYIESLKKSLSLGGKLYMEITPYE